MNKISIIVPVYNCELYIQKCIESLLSQTYNNIEIILIDDGSTDSSGSICDAYAAGYQEKIKVFHKTNGGEASARNDGIEKATGTLIGFCDADDYVAEDYFYKLVLAMQLSKGDIAVASLKKVDNNGNVFQFVQLKSDYSGSFELLSDIHRTGQFIAAYRCLFKKEVITDNRLIFGNYKTGADQNFTYKYMLSSNSAAIVKDAVYFYRQNTSSIMHQKTYIHFEALDAMFDVLDCAKRKLNEEQFHTLEYLVFNNICIHLICFSVLTLLSAEENVNSLKKYLYSKSYAGILNRAVVAKNKRYYMFWRLWKLSPDVCLYFYSTRKKAGKLLRRILK
jgi:glycosyltransferase involved in cell wall biosynthesis